MKRFEQKWGDGMEYLSHSPEETERIGEELGRTLHPGCVVAFRGGLGMGKTAFTRGLARGLGCRGRVTSPTFTIVNEYSGDIPLFHFDMYRLGGEDELFDIGWEDYLARGGVCAVEWSEQVSGALPEDAVWVDIARGDNENDRIITITRDCEDTGAGDIGQERVRRCHGKWRGSGLRLSEPRADPQCDADAPHRWDAAYSGAVAG